MERLTDRKVAENLKSNIEGLRKVGIDIPIDDLCYIKLAEYEKLTADHRQLAEWLKELKEKLCDSSEYCGCCDELDISEHGHFTCKYKKKKIPAVCDWQVLTPEHFDDIPWTKNKV